jgi:hypothetical protein
VAACAWLLTALQYVFDMQNCSSVLSQECQSAYDEDSAYKCMMAPHAAGFVKTPWFALQSRFDKWSLGNEVPPLPCSLLLRSLMFCLAVIHQVHE